MIRQYDTKIFTYDTIHIVQYWQLWVGVAMVKQLGGEVVELYSDSRLVMGQVNGEFETQDERMQGYLAKV